MNLNDEERILAKQLTSYCLNINVNISKEKSFLLVQPKNEKYLQNQILLPHDELQLQDLEHL